MALTILSVTTMGFIASFLQSRRMSESSVLHAAASSLVYGIVEQIKSLEYSTALPSRENDVNPDDPDVIWGEAPFVRVRLNQDESAWLRVVYTGPEATPRGPTTTPAPGVTPSGAISNVLDSLPLSTVAGATSQELALTVWVWIDELAPAGNDATEVKKVTVIYTYPFMDGRRRRVVVDREVFIRTRFDQ